MAKIQLDKLLLLNDLYPIFITNSHNFMIVMLHEIY